MVTSIDDLAEYGPFYGETDEEELKQNLLARVVFDKSMEGMIVTNQKGIIQTINPAFEEITGFLAEELVGRHVKILSSDKHSKSFYKRIEKELSEKGQWRGELWNGKKDGTDTLELVTINSAYSKENKPRFYIGVFHDMEKIKEENELVSKKGYYDVLTGLPSRHLLHDRIAYELKKAHRQGTFVAVLILDIDDFKIVNNELSRTIGDTILEDVTYRIQDCVREEDTIARTGGDEFTILLSQLEKPENAAEVARRIFSEFKKPFLAKQQEVFLTTSMGISIYPHDGKDLGTILQNADLALTKAKTDNKNNYQFYTDTLHKKAEKKLETEAKLRHAIENWDIAVYYQPIIDLKKNKVHGAEALARWIIDGKVISPINFIPLAEETGLIIPIGEGIIKNVFTQGLYWNKEYNWNLQVSINLSARQLLSESLLTFINTIITATGISPQLITLEITENCLIQNVEQSKKILWNLKEMGINISLDDFGTGYSSLSYLREFPIDILKIDKSFIFNLNSSLKDASIVSAIISMAHSLDMTVVAEGIETKDQYKRLVESGCDYGQGYLFSKPVSSSNLEVFMHRSFLK